VTTELRFQVAGAAPDTLLACILDACQGAHRGGGIFAWTTVHGVRALLDNPTFLAFTKQGDFDLVVGTDTITDPKAVDALRERNNNIARLAIRAFIHDEQPLFHPKMIWFQKGDNLTLIVGSGNLTRGGLQSNWEIFTCSQLSGDAASEVVDQITDWLDRQIQHLVPLDDRRVDDVVAHNAGDERTLRRPPTRRSRHEEELAEGHACLVAEIPKNRKNSEGDSLFSQANFTQAVFEEFFRVHGYQTDVLLYHVRSDGSLDELESRQGRYKPVSRNYYIELGSVSGKTYPSNGSPIGAFRRLPTNEVLYLVRLPGEDGYAELDALLSARWSGDFRLKRRVEITDLELGSAWPGCPLVLASAPGL
jgi:hypothetical protein